MKTTKGRPLPYGVTITGEGVNFSFAAKGEACSLLLYESGMTSPCAFFPMEETLPGLFCLSVDITDPWNYEYNYQLDGTVILDPLAKKITGRYEWLEERSEAAHQVRACLTLPSFDWGRDESPLIPDEDAVAYALHVRGFTMDDPSVKNPGTFEGVLEKISYLKNLGINRLHLMPVYDFKERVPKTNYWGYGEGYYFAPKNAYSACGDGSLSLKCFVKECHENGIEVILEMPFSENIPGAFILDCLREYVLSYHVDGFLVDPYRMAIDVAESDPVLAGKKILFYRDDFQNTMRSFLRGDEGKMEAFRYWFNESDRRNFHYLASHNGFTLNDLVSYNEKHNEANDEKNRDGSNYNFSWNCGDEGASRKKTVRDLRRKQMKNAWMLLLLSRGVPCILSGDEMCNSQKGNNNAYCQDNPIGWVNWNTSFRANEQKKFVMQLMKIREDYPMLHTKEPHRFKDLSGCGIPDVSFHGREAWRHDTVAEGRQIGILYHDASNFKNLYVVYNMSETSYEFALPNVTKKKGWHLLLSSSDIFMYRKNAIYKKCVTVPEHSISIFVGEK